MSWASTASVRADGGSRVLRTWGKQGCHGGDEPREANGRGDLLLVQGFQNKSLYLNVEM